MNTFWTWGGWVLALGLLAIWLWSGRPAALTSDQLVRIPDVLWLENGTCHLHYAYVNPAQKPRTVHTRINPANPTQIHPDDRIQWPVERGGCILPNAP